MSGMCVLVVEDEWIIAELLVETLQDAGYRIVGPVAQVSEALALIDRDVPNVALLDVSLRGEWSYPIARELAARGVPFIFMTGYAPGNLPEEFKGTPVVTKPVALSSLVRSIEMLL